MRRILVALALALAGDASAQLVAENAGTLPPDTPLARLKIYAAEWRHVDEFGAVGEFHYGIHPRLEASALVPLLYKKLEIGDRHESFSGVGDAWLNLKLNVHKTDGVMSSDRVAVLAGIKFPTGKWDDTLRGEEIPFARKLQLGTGTFDGRIGVAITYINDRHRFSIDAWGQASSKRDGVRPGPILRADAAYWCRLFPAAFAEGESGMELRLVADAWYMHRWHTSGELGSDAGNQFWIAPGLQFNATKWLTLEGNVAVPLVDTIKDEYGHSRWSAFVAVKIYF